MVNRVPDSVQNVHVAKGWRENESEKAGKDHDRNWASGLLIRERVSGEGGCVLKEVRE
jgi:hypothetical protein